MFNKKRFAFIFIFLFIMCVLQTAQASVGLVVPPKAPDGDGPVAGVEPPYLISGYAVDLRVGDYFTLGFIQAPAPHAHVASHYLLPCEAADALIIVDDSRTCRLTDHGRTVLRQRFKEFGAGRSVMQFMQETALQLLLLAVSHHEGLRLVDPADLLSIQLILAASQGRYVFSPSRYLALSRSIWARCCGGEAEIKMQSEEARDVVSVLIPFFSSLAQQMSEALTEA